MKCVLRARACLFIACAIAVPGFASPANAQPDQKITVKFKIFDTNEPTRRLTPINKASNFVRDPVTKKAEFLESVDVTRPEKDGLDELRVSKGWLIEQLVIQIDDPQRDYNPAIITKVVSAADMTVYPGASKSTDAFRFQAYIAQMGAYRTLLEQLLTEVDTALHDRIRGNLRAAFQNQLVNMSDIDKRLINPTPEERTAARKLVNEVLKVYGLPHQEDQVHDQPCTPEQLQCTPCHRGGLLRRCR